MVVKVERRASPQLYELRVGAQLRLLLCRLSLPLLGCTRKQDGEEATKKTYKDDYKPSPAPKPDNGDEEGEEGDGGEEAPDNDGEMDGEEGETTYGKVGPQGECRRCWGINSH